MNINKEVIKNVRELLASSKEKLEELGESEEAKVLLEQIEQAQETNDDNLKVECEKIYNDLKDDKYSEIRALSSLLSKTL